MVMSMKKLSDITGIVSSSPPQSGHPPDKKDNLAVVFFCRADARIAAERTRFELVVRNDPYVGLANRWFQPLTHLSFGLPPGNPGMGGQSYNNLFVLQAIGRKNKQFIPRANRNSLPRSLRAAEDGENLIAHVAVLLHALEEI